MSGVKQPSANGTGQLEKSLRTMTEAEYKKEHKRRQAAHRRASKKPRQADKDAE